MKPAAPPTLRPGTVLDVRYRLGEKLGQGGMATVYRAEHLTMRREVALKVLDTATSPAAFAQRFEREARAVARLDHPGCVRVFDYGRSMGRHYLAMELLEGRTLADELARCGRFPPGLAAQLARQLLDALSHAHRNGVLHRDVKPANAILTRRGASQRLVLIDFGLARLEDESPLTAAGICAGSPSYIPPERLAGEPYDVRADVYAVGVVLYELLAGRRPFTGESAKAIARKTLHEDPAPLATLRRDVTPELDALVMRSLAKDPAVRFQDAESMRAALRALDLRPGRASCSPAPAAPAPDPTLELRLRRRPWWRRLLDALAGDPTGTVEVSAVSRS